MPRGGTRGARPEFRSGRGCRAVLEGRAGLELWLGELGKGRGVGVVGEAGKANGQGPGE